MNNVKKNKNNDRYKFSNTAISLLIILNFTFGILPMIFLIEKIIPNIVNMLLYLIFGAPSSNSVFLMAFLFNSTDHSGGNKIEEQNGFMIIIFFIFNLFFEGLIFFNTDRTQRVKAVLILSITFTIYNFFKQLGIILRIFTVGNKLQNIIQNKNNLIDISKKIKDLKVKELNINDIKNNSHSNEGIDKIVNDLENEYNIIEENKGNGNRNENEGINNFEEVKNEGSIQNDNKINDNDNNNNYDDNFDDD
jgi:hypothetical protein